ncbi:hypothetical protein [Comamonas sp.]|uniref:hypothetical protein n=1 Tax=Comamonas sp. TaxID=34028 RepID=UPI003D109B55
MATVHQMITAALAAIPNCWAVELPPHPAFPAVVFDVETEPETGWCINGGYDQHEVQIIALADTLEELDALIPTGPGSARVGGPIRSAIEAMEFFQYEASCGDADYEPDPRKYGRHLTVWLRTPRF